MSNDDAATPTPDPLRPSGASDRPGTSGGPSGGAQEPTTGPLHPVGGALPGTPGADTDWRSRPSGALSSPGWGAPTGGYGPAGTSAYPSYGGRYGDPAWSSPATGAYGAPGAGPAATGSGTGTGTGTLTAQRPGRARRTAAIVGSTVVLALGAGFGGGVVGARVADSGTGVDSSLSQSAPANTVSSTTPAQPAAAGSVQSVATKLLPSVVSIVSLSQSAEGEGSGVILSSDGLILTNNHVIAGASTLTVRFNDGTSAQAKVIGADATDDLAVIKAQGVSGLTVAALGKSSDLQVGQPVVAVGSPLGLSATVTSGIVSALNRPVRTAAEDQTSQSAQDTVLNAIQTDAAINPGNSGGPLVNMQGQVIGINSAIASLSSGQSQAGSIGVGFAIPIDQARRIAQEIVDTGSASHAVLGASVTDATTGSQGGTTGLSTGARLAAITSGGGANKAGLEVGDVVTKVGNQTVESADALIAAIRSATPNGQIQVTYLRDGKTATDTVTLGSATSK
ncbi:S1C family serine protease [Nakamurella endophytica]|uniref:PDZ domain-containing protein n=1 Tax=Nakamurella endophytica TaxID=1748367 RepID=A0A917SWK4_9ACTN|nr:trypsin-like peptidase domain-containing protein [Nakamurella endophytica]GGM00139.1 hypothetical protein GCM10011594_20270 [Nakamurella endophytica]